MKMPPLQTSYLDTGDPTQFLLITRGIAVLVIIVSIVRYLQRGGPKGTKTGGGGRSSGGPGFWALRKTASQYGLSSDESSFLAEVLTQHHLTNPERVMSNPAVLDKIFAKTYDRIERQAKSEAEAERDKTFLFSIRQSVEAAHSQSFQINTTRRIPSGYPATLKTETGEQYPTRLLGTKTERLLTEAPRNAVGSLLRFARGTHFTVSFYAKNNQGFTFETKALGSDEFEGSPVLVLSHSEHVTALPGRKHKRQPSHIAAGFSTAHIVELQEGKMIRKKLVVDEGNTNGIITDISAGGCALKSVSPIKTGEYLKIEFTDTHERNLVALGRVVRTNKTGGIGGIMHIQFMKVPTKTSNAIQALVYGYEGN